jgi:hypothetical protein
MRISDRGAPVEAKLAGRAPAFYPLRMAGKDKPGDPRRAERLKAALRDNLKRRKAQERARAKDAEKVAPPVRPRESGDAGAKDH